MMIEVSFDGKNWFAATTAAEIFMPSVIQEDRGEFFLLSSGWTPCFWRWKT